jgi:hypothetical protein
MLRKLETVLGHRAPVEGRAQRHQAGPDKLPIVRLGAVAEHRDVAERYAVCPARAASVSGMMVVRNSI